MIYLCSSKYSPDSQRKALNCILRLKVNQRLNKGIYKDVSYLKKQELSYLVFFIVITGITTLTSKQLGKKMLKHLFLPDF